MDRLTLLEDALATALKTIDGTLQPRGYQYNTVTGEVFIEDTILAEATAGDATKINHVLTPYEGEENEEWGLAQNILTNMATYNIVSTIHLVGDEANPKRSATIKCNELLSDIKHCLFVNNSLGEQCNWVKYNSKEIQHTANGDIINGAKLVTEIEINYSQSMINPNTIAC